MAANNTRKDRPPPRLNILCTILAIILFVVCSEIQYSNSQDTSQKTPVVEKSHAQQQIATDSQSQEHIDAQHHYPGGVSTMSSRDLLENPGQQRYAPYTSADPASASETVLTGSDQENPFGYLSSAKEDMNKELAKKSNVDTRFFQRPFLDTQRPLKNETVAVGLPYKIDWRKNKYIPIDIRSFIVNIGKETPSNFHRYARIASISANSREYKPIEFTIPDNYSDDYYTLEYIGFLEPGNAIVGPQYSQTFYLSHKAPGMFTRFSNSVRQRLPGQKNVE